MEPVRADIVARIMKHIEHMHEQPQIGPWNEWSRIDLTLQQIKTLAALWGRHALRMRELSDLMGVNLSTMTGIVDRLIERALVERGSDPEDRRIVLVQLSEAGREEILRIMSVGRTQFEMLLDYIATEDLPVVDAAMDIMVRASERAMTAHTQTIELGATAETDRVDHA